MGHCIDVEMSTETSFGKVQMLHAFSNKLEFI